jgi:HAD superfamily hydrolase (TIGR01509 family)
MLRGVIFDLDGVVVDSHPAHKRAWKRLLAGLYKTITEQEMEFVVEGHKRSEILLHFLGDLTDEQIASYGELKERLFKQADLELKTIPGFDQFFQQIEDAKLACAVASSAGRARVESTLLRLNLTNRFHAVVAGDDVANGKPNPDIFHLAASRLRLSQDEVLVCEDAVNGVYAAKAAGMRCLALATQGREHLLQKAGADTVVADFSTVRLDQLQKLFTRA